MSKSMATIVIQSTPNHENPEIMNTKVDVIGFGMAGELANTLARAINAVTDEAKRSLSARETPVPESERCGENLEPASPPVI